MASIILDTAVLEAYPSSAGKGLLNELLDLSLIVAQVVDQDKTVPVPGIPSP